MSQMTVYNKFHFQQAYKRVRDFFKGQSTRITLQKRGSSRFAKDEAFHSPGDYVRFISPEVYRSNRQRYLGSYTFKSYEDEDNLSSKKQSKWFKNKKNMNKKNMNKFKKTSVSLGNSLKSCLLLLLSCFHV
ncbi:hypothetical protein Bca4012_098314 [Brassica carinata]|uniref:Uncharacterized protein n=1 Tax=Brassica carinata TaxID=52824 RepID=A0A8X7PED4_BRACI|nr:hypothetical protein Bca52824_081000 [Brassica carinata]